MVFRNFRANVVVRLGAFVLLSSIAIWGFVNTDWQLTPVVCAVLAVIVLIELARYVESVNRELAAFLEFVSHDDFSSSFPIGQKGRVFDRLEIAYKRLLAKYRGLNQARELNHRYLESLVEHVSVALICFDQDGRITLMNRQAKRLFGTPHLHDIGSLKRIDARLPDELAALEDGARILMRLSIGGEELQLALYVTEFELLERGYKLISFQNIRDELEQREVDFSGKLITVLTHEIMNSVTPIIALCKVIEETLREAAVESGTESVPESAERTAGTAADRTTDREPERATDREPERATDRAVPLADTRDLLRSVASIQARGDGLLRFVQAYRSLTSLPRPNRKQVELKALLEQTVTLLAPAAEAAAVSLSTRVEPERLTIEADAEQIQQVLINLVNNALEALHGRPDGSILLTASQDSRRRAVIRVTDNGPGMEAAQLDQIFVPFYTTKARGTGVGLSVSRQIMLLNHGSLTVKSQPGMGTEFSLVFR